jgi:DNA-directed RNA polymerase subunit alpha
MVWKSLKMPRNFQKTEISENGRHAKFEIEALERGWGTTIGNALRRTLLSSIQGAAIVSVKIDKVVKEYANIPGVREDITDIILNLKAIRVKLLSDKDETLRLDVSGNGDVTAKDIDVNPAVAILNPEVHIATLSGDNASLCIEMKVSSGRGYVPADDPDRRRAAENAPVGEILIDANYNPVLNVAMNVSDTRVEERTDFNRLELDITTDGSIDPEDALAYAAKLLLDHLEIFINFEGDLDSDGPEIDGDRDIIRSKLLLNVDDLELSVRSSNCLRQAGIRTISELVRHKESDMLKHKNFGRKSLIELNELLSSMGLSFGMDVDAYLKEGNAE